MPFFSNTRRRNRKSYRESCREMMERALPSVIFAIVFLISIYIFTEKVDLRSHFFSFSRSKQTIPCNTDSQPLKVFMYDLPVRFNMGLINRNFSNEIVLNGTNFPSWPLHSGLMKQHSVEYWMMASLLYEGNEEWREVVRVSDAEKADAFFVPFFSSMSLHTHGQNTTEPDTEIDRQLQIELLEFLRNSTYWQKSGGRDHVIPMTHPNAFKFLREEVNASMLIVVDFGRLPRKMARLSKDVVSPYVHVVESFTDDNSTNPFESRRTLLFFRGRTVRKDEGVVRAKLAKILAGNEDVVYEESLATGEGIKASTQGMRSSKFCLSPAGDTPSSCRLFDAIVSHCIPVIVSNKIELPFEDNLDYTQFSFFFSVKEALEPGNMVGKLRKVQKDKWLEMWMKLKNISRHYEFEYPPKKEDAVNMLWRQVRHKLPAARLSEHRSRRLKIPDWWNRRRRI